MTFSDTTARNEASFQTHGKTDEETNGPMEQDGQTGMEVEIVI